MPGGSGPNDAENVSKTSRRRILEASALGIASSALVQGAAAGEPQSSAEKPDGVTAESVDPYYGGSHFVVVKDCHPWGVDANEQALQEMGEHYDRINSSQLSSYDLSSHAIAVLPSTQSRSYYDNLRQNAGEIEQFVANGGVLLAHVTDDGWPCTTETSVSYLPGNVSKSSEYDDYLSVYDNSHPITTNVTDNSLDNWNFSTHGHFTSTPQSAEALMGLEGGNEPTYIEYEYGDGVVLATTQTIEWPWQTNYGTEDLLRDEFTYALASTEQKSVHIEEANNTVSLNNSNCTGDGDLALEVGDIYSTNWRISGQDVLFEEYFALRDGDGNVAVSFEPIAVQYELPEQGEPGEVYSTFLKYDLGGKSVGVLRKITLAAGINKLEIEYEISNTGTERIDSVEFIQYCDFDIGDPSGNSAEYVAASDFVKVTDGDIAAGFGADQTSAHHHLDLYAENEDVVSDPLNDDDSVPTTGSDDVVTAMEWSLGALDATGCNRGNTCWRDLTISFGITEQPSTIGSIVPKPLDELLPEVVQINAPPTAVEVDERAPFSIEIDPNLVDPEHISIDADSFMDWRGSSGLKLVEHPVDKAILNRGNLLFSGELPKANDVATFPKGAEFEFAIQLEVCDQIYGDPQYDGDYVFRKSTFAFNRVEDVYGIVARPRDATADQYSLIQNDLDAHLKEKVEYVNRHYASGLGSMGMQGFRFTWLHQDYPSVVDDQGYLELPKTHSEYYDGGAGGNYNDSTDFVQDGLDTASDKTYVDYDYYDLSLVTSGPYTSRDDVLSRSFYQGNALPDIRVPVINKEIPLDAISGMDPFDTNGGTTDGIYVPLLEDTWVHELGHGLGPGNRVGFPDIYPTSAPFQSFGNLGDWGLMGSRGGKVISSFCRGLGYDPSEAGDGWLDEVVHSHILDDTNVEVPAVTELIEGDEANYILSIWGTFSVDVGLKIPDVDVGWKLGIFLLEGRYHGDADFSAPEYTPTLSPAPADGVELFEFGIIDLDVDTPGVKDIIDDISSGETPDLPSLNDVELIDIDHVPPSAGQANTPTLQSSNDTYNHARSATEFKLEDNLNVDDDSNDTADVKLKRNKGKLGDVIHFVNKIMGGLEDYVSGGPYLAAGSDPLPGLDVIAVTQDGRRAGFDPATGEVINEIEGAEIGGTPSETRISVPISESVELIVSSQRLEEELENRGLELEREFEYEQRIILDEDVSIEDREGLPFISGRIEMRDEANVSASTTAVRDVEVDITPRKLNPKSNGQFVNVDLGFDSDVNVDQLQISSIVLGGVQAVYDTSYGFVSNPPVRRQDDKVFVRVKFPRGELISELGEGEVTPQILGSVDGGLFRGEGVVTIKKNKH